MMNKKRLFGAIFLSVMILVSLASAEVGLGVSPSKIRLAVNGGESQEIEMLVFNSGDNPLDVQLVAEGDIAKYVEITPAGTISLEPEPKPHALPIKNGKTFIIKFNPPMTFTTKTLTGKISAVGSPTAEMQFGGSIGVAMQVELIVSPSGTGYIWYIVIGVLAALAIIVWLMKRARPKGRKAKK
jgi:hypothetical protein